MSSTDQIRSLFPKAAPRFRFRTAVRIELSDEAGEVQGRAEYLGAQDCYLVFVLSADGRAEHRWVDDHNLNPDDGRAICGDGFNEVRFAHEIGDRVRIAISGETGVIRGRAQIDEIWRRPRCSYLLAYRAADGRAVLDWWPGHELEAAPSVEAAAPIDPAPATPSAAA